MTGQVRAEAEVDAAEFRALADQILRESQPGQAWARLATSGFTLVGIPESAGGSGGGVLDAVAVLTAAAGVGVSLPLVETSWLAGWVASESGVKAPDGPVTFAVAGNRVQASTAGSECVLEGSLGGVPWRHYVREAYVFVPSAGLVAVVPLSGDAVLDANAVGLCRGDLVLPGPARPVPFFRVADTDAARHELMLRSALARTAQIAGASAAIRDLAVRYAQEREQFGRPLSRFQVIQHYLAQVAAETYAVRTASAQAAAAYARGGPSAETVVSAAKAVASLTVGRTTKLAHQVLGAIGTTREHKLHRYTVAMWDWRDDGGSEFDHADAIGRAALQHGRSDVWAWLEGLEGT